MNSFTPEQKAFETKWHYKVIRPLNKHYQLPQKQYVVTSALLDYENENKTTIFAIKATDYTFENKHMFTFKIDKSEIDVCMSDFEIIEDGYEKYVKPVILDEVLNSWSEDDANHWKLQFSSYIYPEKCGKVDKIPKGEIKREILDGMDEYMFIYRSIFDIDKPSCYIVKIPILQYKEQVIGFIKSFRQDVLDNKVAFGVNRRLLLS